ncbi:MAG TPA: hypothetical protein VJ889_03400, partial [Pseudomonas sp.]|nr:hypothetical protein [Pseudomonas sp.]
TLTLVAATGAYTVVQNNPILHAAGLNENNQAFTINYRVTDGDGDTADGTLGINVDDDTPVVTAKSNLVYANTSNPPPGTDVGGTGVFAYSIGADKHLTPYSATNSDFLSVALTGVTVGTNAITNKVVTWDSETDSQAVFDVSFTYVSNNPTQGATSNATGTLTFNKEADTYTLKLDQEIESFSILKTSTAKGFQGYELNSMVEDNSGLPDVSVARLADDFQVQFIGFQETGGNTPVKLTAGSTLPTNFAHGELFTGPASTVSVSGIAAGVASDTLQPGEVMDLDFFTSNPKGDTNAPADATSKAIYLKFDGIGLGADKEDLVIVLKLIDPDGSNNPITRAFIVDNSDIIQNGSSIANPSEYGIVLDQNDGAVIFESNDFNFGDENYEIQGAQVLVSTQGLSGTGYNFNGFVATSNVAGDNNGATPSSPQQAFGDQNGEKSNQLDTIGGLAEAATWDGDVIKITDIGFVTSTTPDAHLTFDVVLADADADATGTETLDVTIVGGNTFTGGANVDTFSFRGLDTDTDGALSAATAVISGGFTSGVDKLDFTVAGTGPNYTEVLAPAANLAAFITAANTVLDGAKNYYFGVVGGDGYLAFDGDGSGITGIIQLVGVTDIASTDIV